MSEKKKTKRRMKKQVRKTLGALFLASAVAVAAIPTTSMEGGVAQADTTGTRNTKKVTLYENADAKTAGQTASGTTTNTPTMDTLIPVVPDTATIYTTGPNADGSIYQFAYVNFGSSGGTNNWVAVILGYNKGNTLPNGELTIPDTVNAYIQPTGNQGTTNGYVAASQSGETLYYEKVGTGTRQVQAKNSNGLLLYYPVDEKNSTDTNIKVDYNGTPTPDPASGEKVMTTETFKHGSIEICSFDNDEWKNLDLTKFYYAVDGETADTVNECYSLDSTGELETQTYTGYKNVGTDSEHQWIKNAVVKYIGNQYLDQDATTKKYSAGDYITDSTSSRGIFAGEGNIKTLKIGENLIGVGNYAFSGCTSLSAITFGNGLTVIGNWAFSNCTSLASVNVPEATNLSTLGDHAFYSCTGLPTMTVPINVQFVGDYCFAGCTILSTIDFINGANQAGTEKSNMYVSHSVLKEMGWSVFEDDTTLSYFIFPDNFTGTVELSMFKNCSNLHYIASHNQSGLLTFVEDDYFSIKSFKQMMEDSPSVAGTFYFEGYPGIGTDSPIHAFTKEKCFAFSSLQYDATKLMHELKNEYELTVQELDADGNETTTEGYRSTYVVNNQNELIRNSMGSDVTSLTIPNKIGPYSITKIEDKLFENNCKLSKVTIPESITYIGEAAFRGCHNLENVIFETTDGKNLTIGEEAFRTQKYTIGASNHTCGTGIQTNTTTNQPVKELHFVGPISSSSAPYRYAMSYDGRYNNDSQKVSFITYYSGWPTNLTIQYDYDSTAGTGTRTLVNFPAYAELPSYAGDAYNAYMTAEYKQAATTALSTPEAARTEAQQAFIDSALNIVIPEGVDTIKDGLFAEKEAADGKDRKKTVTSYGLNSIQMGGVYKNAKGEVVNAYDPSGTIEPEYVSSGDANVAKQTGDFRGCESLSELYLYGPTSIIEPYAFEDCSGLQKIVLNGNIYTIGDYAFKNCEELDEASVSDTVNSLGKIPFTECPKLTTVDFENSSNYVCDNSIIYKTSGGKKTAIVECLEGRTSKFVRDTEVDGITTLMPEAFANTSVTQIDLTGSDILTVPTGAFNNTTKLNTVKLPDTCTSIQESAFVGSSVEYVEIPDQVTIINPLAFEGALVTEEAPDYTYNLTLITPEDSYAWNFGTNYHYTVESMPRTVYYTVRFFDWDETVSGNVQVGEDQRILEGEDAVPPEPKGKSGYVFSKWDPSYKEISEDTTCFAVYDTEPEGYGKHKVTYVNYDDSVWATEYVADGGDAVMNFPAPTRKGYTFVGWTGNLTNIKADTTVYADYEDGYLVRYFYYDEDNNKKLVSSTYVAEGGDAPDLASPITKSGYKFTGWLPSIKNITEPTDTYAQYESDGSTGVYTVNYYSYDGSTVLYTQKVLEGNDAPDMRGPDRDGYTFTGWLPSLKNVTSDRDVVATYTAGSSSSSTTSGNGTSTSGNGSSGTGSSGTTTNGKYYVLTVVNGSGSGSYLAGAQPIIVANDPASNQEFSSWSVTPSETVVASKALSATVVTMPEENVTITANYKAKSSSSGTGTTTGSGNSVVRPTSNSTINNGGNTVVIDKNGLSNTGVVSAVVNGSSDNFTIKITDSSTASEAIVKALMAEYGDLSNIKYFPMDISLYDSTGNKKVSDTTGLKITITLPLPDSLREYAGNNKVAGVVNDKLDKLTPRFTTISGVPCITFTAEHFSPYVIYVDTTNLTAGSTIDTTPKTGDRIHPKWFLSAGMALISVVLFMKKDSKPKKKLAKVRA